MPPRFQQTRFQQRITQSGNLLETWAENPWRRLSLLLMVLLGGFVIGVLEVLTQAFLPDGLSPYRDAIVLALVIAALLWRPDGLLPAKNANRS